MRFSIPCQFLICSISKYVHLLRSLKAQTANYLCENYLKSQCFFFKNRSRSLSLSLTPEGSVCGSVPFLTRLHLVQMLIKNRAPKHCSLYLSIYLPVSILSIYLSKCLSIYPPLDAAPAGEAAWLGELPPVQQAGAQVAPGQAALRLQSYDGICK